jgi:hypothetical protein
VERREQDHVINLVKSHPAAALEPARAIADPYLRCQALAWVARHCERAVDATKLATEASEGVERGADTWAAVAGVAWPIGALVERAQVREADALIRRAVVSAERIENPVRKVDALFLVVQAGWAAGTSGWQSAVAALLAAARTDASEKSQGVIRDLVLMLARDGRDTSAALAALPEGRARHEAERRLRAGSYAAPRSFFW